MKLFVALGLCIASWLAVSREVLAEQPKLVVVVSVDQFAQDYLVRFSDNFAEQGLFRRVAKDGAAYGNCHHRHAFTFTAPGHAVLLTGAFPNTHGIIDNDWFDRDQKAMRYCVSDSSVKVVGTDSKKGMSPRSLLVNTVGDQMKLANRQAKVFGVAIKDRASILMAGHMADAAFWLDSNMWVTTEYYRGDLPSYLTEINSKNQIDEYRGKKWELLLPKAKYHNNGPDENDWENPPKGFTSAFPHELYAVGKGDAKSFGDQVLGSPFGNEFTLRAARAVVTGEELGKDGITDLLCINLSSNDYVGHAYGPHSYEAEDMTYRTDIQLGEFTKFLDEQVGAGKWTFFLSADHAVAPIPEYAQKLKLPALRAPLPKERIQKELEEVLRERLNAQVGSPPIIQAVEDQQLLLLREHPALAAENFSRAQRLARNWLLMQPHVAMAKTRDELLTGDGDRLHDQIRLSFNPHRSGDVLWVLNPYCIPGNGTTKKGTTHGSPWYYDTNVPLLAVGSGIRNVTSVRPVSPACLASTVAQLVSVNPPSANVEQPLVEALGK
jgi:predicted AlkP superfamily pyrophosphatase or phosphodiesterase